MNQIIIPDDKVSEIVFWHIRKNFRTLSEAAKFYGCSASYLSAVQTGKKKPSKKILADVGLKKITCYIALDKQKL